MARSLFRVLAITAVLAFCTLFLSDAAAQESKGRVVRIRRIRGKTERTPQYKVVGGPQGRSRDWYEITVEYDTAPEWIDELEFRYYVLMKTQKGRTQHILFRGDVTYVNIEKNMATRHKSAVYIHPSTLARYGEVERIAVLIYHEGRLEDMESDPSTKQRWWEQLTPQRGYILNRMQTPFAMINFDDYEAIKAESTR